jgi:hypothetical protein
MLTTAPREVRPIPDRPNQGPVFDDERLKIAMTRQ